MSGAAAQPRKNGSARNQGLRGDAATAMMARPASDRGSTPSRERNVSCGDCPLSPTARGGHAGRRLPLEQPALREGQTHQRQDDRVQHLPRVEGEEHHRDQSLRSGGPRARPRAPYVYGRAAVPTMRASSPGPGAGAAARTAPRAPSRSTPTAAPAARSSPRTGQPSRAGALRLRLRLSKIFQRLISGRRFRATPRRGRNQRKQPQENLPVTSHPATLAPHVRQNGRRVVVHDLDVADQCHARVEALEQVV